MLAELDGTYGASSESTSPSSIVKSSRNKRETSEDISTESQIAALESDLLKLNFSKPNQPSASDADLVVYSSLSPNDSTDEISTTEYTTYFAVDLVTTAVFDNDQETSTSLSQVNSSSSRNNSSVEKIQSLVEEIAESPNIDIDSNLISKFNNFTPSKGETELVSDEHSGDVTRVNGTSAKLASYEDLQMAAKGSVTVGAIFALLFTSSIYGIIGMAVSKNELLIGPAIMTAVAGVICFRLIFIDLNVVDVRNSFFGIAYFVVFIGGVLKIVFGLVLLYIAFVLYSHFKKVTDKDVTNQASPATTPSSST